MLIYILYYYLKRVFIIRTLYFVVFNFFAHSLLFLSYITFLEFPYLYVNGEKFDFSEEVLQEGAKLLAIFTKTQHLFRTIYSKVCQESIYFSTQNIKAEIAGILTEFDEHWARFENVRRIIYVYIYKMNLNILIIVFHCIREVRI